MFTRQVYLNQFVWFSIIFQGHCSQFQNCEDCKCAPVLCVCLTNASISQNTYVVRDASCCLSGVASIRTTSVYIPANREAVWGEGVMSSHSLPHLCGTAGSNIFSQGLKKAGCVERHT